MNEITLKESNKIKIFNRIENKYLLNESSFQIIYDFLISNYLRVRFNDLYWLRYHSLYYDTNDLRMYHDHLDNKEDRMKIRIREYQDHEAFLEIKKTMNSHSIKKRQRVQSLEIDSKLSTWIAEYSNIDYKDLNKILDVKYERLSFINKDMNERITCDRNLEFYNYVNDTRYKFNTTTYILEVKKQDNNKSIVEEFMDSLQIYPTKFSKYFIGINVTN